MRKARLNPVPAIMEAEPMATKALAARRKLLESEVSFQLAVCNSSQAGSLGH